MTLSRGNVFIYVILVAIFAQTFGQIPTVPLGRAYILTPEDR